MLREEAPKRDAKIIATVDADPAGVPVAVEAFGAYKDAAAHIKRILRGRRIVKELRPPGDKMAKAQPLEVMFESGNVFVPRGAKWIPEFRRQFAEFPKGRHDDVVDAASLIWWEQSTGGSTLMIGPR
jgi:predicted phage terminase large subunit-like protein